MKTIYKILTFALTAAGLVSCSEVLNENSQSNAEKGETVQKVFTAKFADITKTSISSAGKVCWKQGDRIQYYSSKSGEIGEFIVQKDTNAVDIDATVYDSDVFFIAVYGGNEITDKSGVGFTLSDAISQNQDGNPASNHITAAKTYDLTLDEIKFRNLNSFVKFSFLRDDIYKILFRSNNNSYICSDEVIVSFETDIETDEVVVSMDAEDGYSSIYVDTEGSGTYYISTLPVKLSNGFQIIAYDKDGNRVGSVNSNYPLNLKSGGITDLGMLDDKITMLATPVYDNPVVDMTSETANCYMVKPNSEFQFDARYQGNSTDPIGGTPAVAKVLWETFGTDITPNKGDVVQSAKYSKGIIPIQTANEGNAVVALYDGNTEEILWSWHIWVTDYDPSVQCHSYPWTNSDYMMDRNLGALSATPGDVGALGLLYQWGRKDPFLGSSSIDNSVEAASTLSWPSSQSIPQDKERVSFSISNPTTFLNGNYMPDGSWATNKTKYDPCPAGWRVPDGDNHGPWSNFPSRNDWEGNWKGMIFGAAYCGSDAWFPAAGSRWRDYGNLNYVGDLGLYWSCTPFSNYFYAYNLYFYYSGTVDSQGDDGRARGFSVRCQSDERYVIPKTK